MVALHRIFKSNLFKNCLKELEMNLNLLPAIVTNVSEKFRMALQKIYERYIYLIL